MTLKDNIDKIYILYPYIKLKRKKNVISHIEIGKLIKRCFRLIKVENR